MCPLVDPPPPKRVKSGHLFAKCYKCVFTTKQRMFGDPVLAITKILQYRGLPIPDPAHKATLLASMQKNMTL